MSHLFPDQVRIGLGASYAVFGKVRGAKVTEWRMQTWDAITTAAPWQRSLDTIRAWLGELSPRGAHVSAVLSAELAPLHLLPWREDVTRSEQQALLAADHFRRIYGEAASHWKTTAVPGGYGQPWLASASDANLIQTLTDQIQSAGARLTSVQPLPVSLFNAARKKMADPACWLLMPESKKLTALHLRAGHWSLLQTLPLASIQSEPLADLLLRETRLAGMPDVPATIYLASAGKANAAFGRCKVLEPGWEGTTAVPPDSPLHLLGARS